jgi:hypothetical protein
MRTAPLVILAFLLAHAARAAEELPSFADSPHRAAIPEHGACDVIVTPANWAITLAQVGATSVNDPTRRVFCVAPGDYRARGEVLLLASGAEDQRRYLRFHADDGVENAAQRAERAVFERINVVGDWWVIQGLTIEPRLANTTTFVVVTGGDHNVLDGNLVDGAGQQNARGNVGIALKALEADPATDNVVQRNLVRNGNRERLDVDYVGVLVGRGSVAGADNDRNRVVDNEIADWGDGVAIGSNTDDCQDPAVQHGTVIDGNDVYLTAAKRIDCDSGGPGDGCACAENGIDVKGDPGPDPADWTRLTRNRIWGYRPTTDEHACGGSGSNGQAITAGNACAGHILVASNIVMDSTTGINPAGTGWIIAGNVLHEIRATQGFDIGSVAIHATPAAANLDVQFNTMVAIDSAYDDASPNVDTRCNVVVEDENQIGPGQPRGANHATHFNYLYEGSDANFVESDNATFADAEASAATDLCFWRKRWSGPERVCIPLAATTDASPHLDAVPQCDTDLAAPLGLASVSYMTAAPEPGRLAALAGACATLAALTTCRRCAASSRRAARAPARPAARW